MNKKGLLTQFQFVELLPINKSMNIKSYTALAGNERTVLRSRILSYHRCGYMTRLTIANGDRGRTRYEYKITERKKAELLKRFEDFGSLSKNAKKISETKQETSADLTEKKEADFYLLAMRA